MKVSNLLKLALFSFLCSIICAAGYALTNIEIIAGLTAIGAFMCFISLLMWVCTKIFKCFRCGLNVVIIVITLIASVILGFVVFQTMPITAINDYQNLSPMALMFIVSSITCLVSIMFLVGRYIFIRDKSQVPAEVKINKDTEKSCLKRRWSPKILLAIQIDKGGEKCQHYLKKRHPLLAMYAPSVEEAFAGRQGPCFKLRGNVPKQPMETILG